MRTTVRRFDFGVDAPTDADAAPVLEPVPEAETAPPASSQSVMAEAPSGQAPQIPEPLKWADEVQDPIDDFDAPSVAAEDASQGEPAPTAPASI